MSLLSYNHLSQKCDSMKSIRGRLHVITLQEDLLSHFLSFSRLPGRLLHRREQTDSSHQPLLSVNVSQTEKGTADAAF